MEHTKVELELPTELALPVSVSLEDHYWTIRDQTGHIFMGRKQEKAMKAIVWFLNNCEEIAKCWNGYDKEIERANLAEAALVKFEQLAAEEHASTKAHHDNLIVALRKCRKCTCPRSWPRAGNHEKQCYITIIDEAIAKAEST